VIFQVFPGPGIFKKKIQDFPGGVGTLLVTHTTHQKITVIGNVLALDNVFTDLTYEALLQKIGLVTAVKWQRMWAAVCKQHDRHIDRRNSLE